MVIIYLVANSISKPIRKIEEKIKFVAEGNLNEIIDITGKNEIAEFAANTNKMIVSTRSLVGIVKEKASTLTLSSENFSESAAENYKSIEQISSSISDISTVSSQQDKIAKEIQSNSKDMFEDMNKVAKDVEAMNRFAYDLSSISNQGNDAIRRLNKAKAVLLNWAAIFHKLMIG